MPPTGLRLPSHNSLNHDPIQCRADVENAFSRRRDRQRKLPYHSSVFAAIRVKKQVIKVPVKVAGLQQTIVLAFTRQFRTT